MTGPIRGNDWPQVELPALAEFRPELPVSVIVPCRAGPTELDRTLAALARQRYPHELFEVVVVGAPERADTLLREAPFEVRAIRQEDRGPGALRNAGVRAAAHDILLFLAADLLPEADWLTAHARWHHALPDALTLGASARVSPDGVDAEAIRNRPGTLQDLFAPRFEPCPREPDDLTSPRDDLFRAVNGDNLGVRRGFFEITGAFDESFADWGGEDTEFGYRAFLRGGLFVPVREGFAWRQGLREAEPAARERRLVLARAKLAHRIAHSSFRSRAPGRIWETPQFVVTIRGGALPTSSLLPVVERVLAGPTHDLVVRLELPDDHPERERLERHLEPDPRVRVAPSRPALEDFPASPFQVTLPADRLLPLGVLGQLRETLGTAVLAQSVFPNGGRIEIARAWALQRALRTQREASEFGEVVAIPHRELAGWFPAGLVSPRPAPAPRPEFPLGVEIAAVGARSRAVFAASRRVAWTLAGQRVDVVLADTAAEAAGVEAPVVVLEEAPPQLSVPAFDPWVNNPVGWGASGPEGMGSLGPLDADPEALRKRRWLEAAAASHPDPAARAGELARVAATGGVVQLADGDPELEPYLGAELFALLTSEVRELDDAGREELSVRLRRVALREHALGSRARQVAERVLPDPPRLPLVSVLVSTRRPGFLGQVLEAVREQTYPRLELVLALSGEGFGEVAAPIPLTVLRPEPSLPLGSALNAAAQAARGALLTRMDDDSCYGPEHLWDLVLAHEYSRAPLVGKRGEFVHLAASDRTIRRRGEPGERFGSVNLSSAATLITRSLFERLGGWERSDAGPDRSLVEAAARNGVRAYATHPYGFLVVHRGAADEAPLREWAVLDQPGWRPDLAGLGGAPPPPALPLDRLRRAG